jgi:hypothetical protein
MATQQAQIDPVERELASIQLDEIALAHHGHTWTVWKEAVLDWHLRTLAQAQSQGWVPGLAGRQDAAVEEALRRFHGHHVGVVIGRLRAENVELRRKLLEASDGARFYAGGTTDAGARQPARAAQRF